MKRRFCQNTHRFVTVLEPGEEPVPAELRKKIVNSFNVEFGYELISALPYAYYLHEKGLLEGTISGPDTKCLYYFSPQHSTNIVQRKWGNMTLAKGNANIRIHRHTLDPRFSPPPLKEVYKNDRFVFDKPTVCIFNRINKEWNKGIVNFFDIDFLRKTFEMLLPEYEVIYFNIRGKKALYDGPQPVDIGDYELAREMGVHLIHDLQEQNPDLSFNKLQLMIMANCERFLTMNGGYAILASYMGGTNIIYSKECQELKPEVNSFYRWYHKFGGSRIIHEDNYDAVLGRMNDLFINKSPLINIITRTCNRPNCFDVFYRSVKKQTYLNTNIIVGYHDDDAHKYLIPYKVLPVRYEQYVDEIVPKDDDTKYGRPFPSNHYMNYLLPEIKEGWVVFLDDDDSFTDKNSIQEIVSRITSEDDLLLWRIKVGDRLIPSDDNFGGTPQPRDISGISFCCHSKHLKGYESEPYRLWDYRIILHLYSKLNPVWIDKVLTGMHKGPGYGKRKDRE